MRLLNMLFKGLGFKDNEPQKEIEKEQNKSEQIEKDLQNSFPTFDFNPLQNFPQEANKNLVIYAPKNQNDIKLLIESLKRKESCIVNLAEIDKQEADKILGFLSGAVYALNGSMKRLQGDLFLLVPEGTNIMTKK